MIGKLLSNFFGNYNSSKSKLNLAFINANWMMLNNVIRMVLVLIVSIYLARYLGPSDFGLMNYVFAFVALFAVFSRQGMDDIVIKLLIENKDKKEEIMGTTFLLKFIGAVFLMLSTYIVILFLKPNDFLTISFVIIASSYYIFKSFEVIYFYFISKLKSKYNALAAISSIVLVSILKIIFIILKFPLVYFICLFVLESLIEAIFLVYYYVKISKGNIFSWRFSSKLTKQMLWWSWPLIISMVFTLIYQKIDQIMIGQMMDNASVGYYAVAAKISEVWYYIPAAVSISVFPFIIESRKRNLELYHKNLQKLHNVLTFISVCIALVFTFASNFIITILYGAEYNLAGKVLAIHIWAAVFAFSYIASSKYLVIENLTWVILFRNICGAVLNIVLNLILIPHYGIVGAAYATLISYGFVATFGNLFNKKSRIIFMMFIKSFNFVKSFKDLKNLIYGGENGK